MTQPEIQMRIGQSLQRFHEDSIRNTTSSGRGALSDVLVIGRHNDALDDCLKPMFKKLIVFGNGGGADRMIGFHRLGDF